MSFEISECKMVSLCDTFSAHLVSIRSLNRTHTHCLNTLTSFDGR